MTEIVPLGDRAFLARLGDEDEAARWAEAVREARLDEVAEVVLAYHTVGVHADPDRVGMPRLRDQLARIEPATGSETVGTLVTIPVLYDGDDLEDAARALGLTPDELVRAHAGQDYRVFALGFRPGFPYAGYLPEELQGLPRRSSPRTRVPAGSVAIVGRQTAVYPVVSPGGWHLIGTTPLRIVDPERGLFPIRAGDRLRFAPIGREEFDRRRGEMLRRSGTEAE